VFKISNTRKAHVLKQLSKHLFWTLGETASPLPLARDFACAIDKKSPAAPDASVATSQHAQGDLGVRKGDLPLNGIKLLF
jgi:hypothetical protein